MKRICAAAVLMLLGSPVYAGESFSFVIGGHHVHIETSGHCNSTSCVSVSIPGTYEKRARRDRYDDDDRDAPRPAPVTAAPPASPPPVACVPPAASSRPVASVAPQLAAVPAPQIQPVQPPPVQPVTTAVVPPQPAPPVIAPAPAIIARPSAVARPADAALSAPLPPAATPRISKVAHHIEREPDSPLGDWRTEGSKGMVRIEPCGGSLCGYVLDPATNARGETVLIDMKSKAASEWSGNIYSRDSGNTYYATMALKGPNALRVEACALGRFFCTGNLWSRIGAKPERLVTYRQVSPEPRS
jgi:hypothetical protein